jgi:hypothetical protein
LTLLRKNKVLNLRSAREYIVYNSADWIAGVDYEEPTQDNKDDKNEAYKDNEKQLEDKLEEQEYNQVNSVKVKDLIKDARQDCNSNQHAHQEEKNVDEENYNEEDNKEEKQPWYPNKKWNHK